MKHANAIGQNAVNRLKKSLAILLACLLVARVGLACFANGERYLYFFIIANETAAVLLQCAMMIVIGLMIWIHLKSKAGKICVATVCTCAVLLMISVHVLFASEKRCFAFESGGKRIIVEECSFLLIGRSNVYQEIRPHVVVRLDGNIGTDDGYRPFSNHNYRLVWTEDSVEITYGFGHMGIQMSETFWLR